ncbi:hypothetical protein KPL71_023468 [Citrus sinensis]|uniref:Uncharacterized protein n=1 Tax=Citrus sinensis TaxID=2711 RepID=A0ACB8IJA8_CITSI|nr:hypothetical protein KPL71_023468 [Citrus sinensis]
MDRNEILAKLHKRFPSLPQNALLTIYKARSERMRLLMKNNIPADIRWLIEAKVRSAATPNRQFKNICVLSGFTYGKHKEFVEAAIDLGRSIAARKLHLVYGGGNRGLSKMVSEAAFIRGSQVLGIIPRVLKPLGSSSDSSTGEELVVSGDLATLEALMTLASWAHLHIHQKPIGLLNVNNFYDGFIAFFNHAIKNYFIPSNVKKLFICAHTANELLDMLQAYKPEPDPWTFVLERPNNDGNSSRRTRYAGRALCDLGASINLMPLFVFKQLGVGECRPTTITLQLADKSHAYPEGKIDDVLVKVDKFIFPVDFIVLDFEADKEVPIILGKPFLATGKTLIDVQKREFTMRVNDHQVTFNVLEAMRNPDEVEDCNFLSVVDLVVADRMDRGCSNVLDKVITFEDVEEEDVAAIQTDWMDKQQYDKHNRSRTESSRFAGKIQKSIWMDHGRYKGDKPIHMKLNKATRKDHFPLPFIDQILDRLAGKQRMPFGLYNTPATFQRCMMSIFSDMVEQSLEVFMDDFSVFGDTYNDCLHNLEEVLKRCEMTNLVLDWEKCHFMVQERIVLGHKISKDGIEVDKAKIEVIDKLPPPTSVKGIRSFLGHVGFYRKFIKDFSKVDFANYLVSGLLPPELKFQEKKKFLHDVRSYQWDDPHLYKLCSYQVIRRCVAAEEIPHILKSCHAAAYGGHFGGHRTAAKVMQSGYYWPTIFKDAYEFVKCCDRFGTPKAIISDKGTHFCNKIFAAAMMKYGVRHKIATTYHPQSNGQAEVSNREIKKILEKVVNPTRKDWSLHLHDSLWAYKTTYKTPLEMSLYRIVYGKACYLPLELEHKAHWALKKLNWDMHAAAEQRKLQLCELDELPLFSYENVRIYKERTKHWHDKHIQHRQFNPGQLVLLHNTRLRLFLGKLKSRWSSPFKLLKSYPHGAVDLLDEQTGHEFKVNGHRVKHYIHPAAECSKELSDKLTPKKWNTIFTTLTIEGASWANEEGRVVNKIDLKPIAKVWVKFLKSRLMPTTYTTTVSQERLVLLYVIVQGLPIDVGSIIAKEIRDCAVKTYRTAALLFPSLVTSICVVSGVRLDPRDEHVKNDGAFTAHTIERVAGESMGTTTEPAVVTRARRVIGLEQTI